VVCGPILLLVAALVESPTGFDEAHVQIVDSIIEYFFTYQAIFLLLRN
jgi:hypothetical protein